MSDLLLSNQIFSIVGTTATGKTALAFQLAEEICRQDKAAGVTILSGDSRQVYKGLEVCSGADLPPSWEKTLQFATDGYKHPEFPISFFGTSVIEPTMEWSVAHFRQYALPLLAQSIDSGFTVLVVGGTGLYHEHLFSTDPQLDIPPDEELRMAASQVSLQDLQAKVQLEASAAWEELNESDRANPRRLVRALERSAARTMEAESSLPLEFPLQLDQLKHVTIGIVDSPEHLKEKISQRITDRFQQGVVEEVERLMSRYDDPLWKLPAFTSTGCREIRMYIESQLELEQLKELWLRRELQYAKRQLTWWKKHPYATSVDTFLAKVHQWIDLSTNEDEDWQTAVTQSCILGLC